MEGRKQEWEDRVKKRDQRQAEWKQKQGEGNETSFFDDLMEMDSLYEYYETFAEIFEREKENKESD